MNLENVLHLLHEYISMGTVFRLMMCSKTIRLTIKSDSTPIVRFFQTVFSNKKYIKDDTAQETAETQWSRAKLYLQFTGCCEECGDFHDVYEYHTRYRKRYFCQSCIDDGYFALVPYSKMCYNDFTPKLKIMMQRHTAVYDGRSVLHFYKYDVRAYVA